VFNSHNPTIAIIGANAGIRVALAERFPTQVIILDETPSMVRQQTEIAKLCKELTAAADVALIDDTFSVPVNNLHRKGRTKYGSPYGPQRR
jgi:NAD(P)-dependent dehydrogenase (short-subunit alcohol dehydrogenase family)